MVSSGTGNLLASPWKFRQYGQAGAWVSELFPHVGQCVDDLCFLHGMHGSNSRHGGALLELHTGSDTFVRPSMGSWIGYGLGTENDNLPAFITICPTLTHGGVNNYSSAFLPAVYHGTPLGNASVPSAQAKIPFIDSHTPAVRSGRNSIYCARSTTSSSRRTGPDRRSRRAHPGVRARLSHASRVPEMQDVAGETASTQRSYGLDDPRTQNFGRQCLMARRFAERGVRFVQVTHSYKWDQHGGLKKDHATNAAEVDRPIAGLLCDLKARGLLDETLVLWGGEFGRTPTAQGDDGRDHNPHGYTMWMAGGGVKAGFRYGATDDYGYYAVQDKIHLHDLHATMLHLLGLDHDAADVSSRRPRLPPDRRQWKRRQRDSELRFTSAITGRTSRPTRVARRTDSGSRIQKTELFSRGA